jgi:hypothetical protein
MHENTRLLSAACTATSLIVKSALLTDKSSLKPCIAWDVCGEREMMEGTHDDPRLFQTLQTSYISVSSVHLYPDPTVYWEMLYAPH